ncbi:hypothetical protein KY289_027928 [Solanum tuberosum]|nr:hypothetical protein KY289_027928 [Solanum tuberosum]
MSCLMGSQGVVLATAVVVSAGTVVVFDLLRQKYLSIAEVELTNNNQKSPRQNPILKSCLSSGRGGDYKIENGSRLDNQLSY